MCVGKEMSIIDQVFGKKLGKVSFFEGVFLFQNQVMAKAALYLQKLKMYHGYYFLYLTLPTV